MGYYVLTKDNYGITRKKARHYAIYLYRYYGYRVSIRIIIQFSKNPILHKNIQILKRRSERIFYIEPHL